MEPDEIKVMLISRGLKVTSRRVSILEAIDELHHPTADEILRYIRNKYPVTATATVYKALNILVEREVIDKVHTDNDVLRYDAVTESHHHLYSSGTDRIEDYHDKELTGILRQYFRKKRIPGFKIKDFKLQISGDFTG